MTRSNWGLPAIFFFVLSAAPALASTTIHFDELAGNTPVNGLSFDGIQFGFAYAPTSVADAVFGGNDGFNDNLLVDPELVGPTHDPNGNAAALTFAFASPTTILQFDLGLATNAFDEVELQLFDSRGTPLPPVVITTADLNNCAGGSPCSSEAAYAYAGGAPIGSAKLLFGLTGAGAFALDNLTFTQAPEPASVWLLLGGAAAIAMRKKRRAGAGSTD